ncbi:MAG: phenylalanine--tRNA ligase subunit beta [Patescibacteria group bacterium]|nr:phenylalanine--tRNA ligase subunit beta [Patescibacteria group bacterium]
MNIKILDSWLRDYVKTSATAREIAEKLSLTSVSVEKLEKFNDDFIYEIEVTTNRPDLMSVLGIARETATVLNHLEIKAEFIPLRLPKLDTKGLPNLIEIKNNPKLVNRICAVVMEVKVKDSPQFLKERLETSSIRSLNNLIDVTNYVMRTTGHPAHVFDFDRLSSKTLTIKEATRGQRIETLDGKEHLLFGGEIVAVNDKNEIVDLLGIMGLQNSIVTNDTKRILYFIDNNDNFHIRKASMSLGVRSEAAILNEKGLDAELAYEALLYGIKLYEQIAGGKVISEIIDIYPNKTREAEIEVYQSKINSVIGINIPLSISSKILSDLGFENKISGDRLKVKIPSFRNNDIEIEEDIVEEIARIYGYHNLPSKLPSIEFSITNNSAINEFFFEKRVKDALKYWGFTECYTYSMVSAQFLEGPEQEAITIQNPLNEDLTYMRKTLVPSLLKVASDNKKCHEIKIFELAKVYLKENNGLPKEQSTLAGVIKKTNASFYEIKGLIEQLLSDLGIRNPAFKSSQKGGLGSSIYIEKEYLGEIEVLDSNLIDFEINFETVLKFANLKKEYKPLSKYPQVTEDISVVVDDGIETEGLIAQIKKQSELISDVTLADKFKDSRTFHIVYQHPDRNLTNEDVAKIRKQIITSLKESFKASIK